MKHFKIALIANLILIIPLLVEGQDSDPITVFEGAAVLSLTPANINMSMKPGSSLNQVITLTNNINTPITFYPSVSDLWFNKDKYTTAPPGTFEEHSAASWITISPTKLRIPGGKSGKFLIKLFVPKGSDGGHYAALVFKSTPPPLPHSDDKKVVKPGIKLVSNVFIDVTGSSKPNMEISKFSVTPPRGEKLLSIRVNVRNRGNTHVMPKANIVLVDSTKKFIGQFSEEAIKGISILLPGQFGEIEAEWAGKLVPGKYTAILTLKYGEDQLKVENRNFSVR